MFPAMPMSLVYLPWIETELSKKTTKAPAVARASTLPATIPNTKPKVPNSDPTRGTPLAGPNSVDGFVK